jgi:hypothetical protein
MRRTGNAVEMGKHVKLADLQIETTVILTKLDFI